MKVIPAAMFVEAALSSLAGEPIEQLEAQERECASAVPNRSESFYRGYALGLETARVLLSGMPAAVEAKVEL